MGEDWKIVQSPDYWTMFVLYIDGTEVSLFLNLSINPPRCTKHRGGFCFGDRLICLIQNINTRFVTV